MPTDLKNILFICTGNYYRSRFAEYYLKHLIEESPLESLVIDSKGLNIYDNNNVGPISPYVLDFLAKLSIQSPEQLRPPEPLTASAIEKADLAIALYEHEHRPMVETQFTNLKDQISYWQFPDVPILTPEEMLPALKEKVDVLFQQLMK